MHHLQVIELQEQKDNQFRRDSNTLLEAAAALIADVRRRHPGEDLKCPHMIKLDEAVQLFHIPKRHSF